jgi:hypothetical protein
LKEVVLTQWDRADMQDIDLAKNGDRPVSVACKASITSDPAQLHVIAETAYIYVRLFDASGGVHGQDVSCQSSCVNVLENVRLAWFGKIAMVPRRRAVLQEIGQSYV